MEELDRKINAEFPGSVVRKDLVKAVKGNATVPSYVLEYLLGQYCATDDEATITSGVQTVKDILAKHYVNRNESGLVQSIIREKGRHKVIDKVGVALNDKDDVYEATFANLGIKKILVDPKTVKDHPKLLVGGVWCICDVEYDHQLDAKASPWILGSLKPIQLSKFDNEAYLEARKRFTTDEWIDLLIQSIGFNPEMFGRRDKFHQLVRLVPFCERNYNLIELGPKGTGKSHIYSEFSPHGMLISGGEVTAAKLFVNNANGRLGLVGYWNCVAFDEFAGKMKKPEKALVDIMKNYMANKQFSRGGDMQGAEASMVFVGNTQHTVPYMLKHSDLFDELPAAYHDSAILDRLHHYIPGWEMDMIRGEMFSDGYGFVVDYIAEVLKSMRGLDFSGDYQNHFTLSSDLSIRDRDGIHKTFSGLMKILYPNQDATVEEIEEVLRHSIEGRKRVKDQLVRMDATITGVQFTYTDTVGNSHAVTTLEEDEYPNYYYLRRKGEQEGEEGEGPIDSPEDQVDFGGHEFAQPVAPKASASAEPEPGHKQFQENQKGVSYDAIFGPYLAGAAKIEIVDPYIRLFHQAKNLMEFIETVAKLKADDDEVSVKLTTIEDEDPTKALKQLEYLAQVRNGASQAGINFHVDFDKSRKIHDRFITTDTGWRILLGRGLDFYQFASNDTFDMASRLQELRRVKEFSVTYMREE